MLNISKNSISDSLKLEEFSSYHLLKKSKLRRLPLVIIGILLLLGCICLLLPWTQNVSAKGYITTRSPEQRPQGIQSIIAGKIEQWYVQEGDFVEEGDTIVFLSEIKSEYFDPSLLERTAEQMEAKTQSVDSYSEKVVALDKQYKALQDGLLLKRKQIANKIEQSRNKIKIDSIDLAAFEINLSVAKNQLSRTEELYKKGLKSLSDLQEKELKLQASQAKMSVQQNKLLNQKNALANLQIELLSADQNYGEKLAKAQSEKQTAISSRLESVAESSKLRNKLSNYTERSKLYYLRAPQSGYITKTLKKGLGETVKEGVNIATIMPEKYDLAVEVYVKPQDLALLKIDTEARLRFDGWPAILISGWPASSTGVFSGNIVAIDRFISENGSYRILISPDKNDRDWPSELRVGTGTRAFLLLSNVPIWYELWRKLNGFPAEFYSKGNERNKSVKRKAPIKSIK